MTQKILSLPGSTGRFSTATARRIVALVREGKTLPDIEQEIGIRAVLITQWCQSRPEFGVEVRLARAQAVKDGRRSGKGPGVGSRTEERVAGILEAIEKGLSVAHATAVNGIGVSTWNQWVARDPDLERQVLEAEGRLAQRMLPVVANGDAGWQGAAWTLERRLREVYALPREVPVAERQRMARKMGEQLAEVLVDALADAGLTPQQQEQLRTRLVASMGKVS